MPAIRRFLPFILVLVALLASACSEDATGPGDSDSDPSVPIDLSHPDSLLMSLERVLEHMAITEYRQLLLIPILPVEPHPYRYHFVEGEDAFGESYPDYWEYEEDIACMEVMFSGAPGREGTPGVESIEMEFFLMGSEWEEVSDDVEGDEPPDGTVMRAIDYEFLVDLKDTVDNSDISGFIANGRAWIYLSPVSVGDLTEYRLWKWVDGFGLRGDSFQWSTVKVFYH